MPRKVKPLRPKGSHETDPFAEQDVADEAQDGQVKPSIVVEFDAVGSAQFTYVMSGGVTPQMVWAAADELHFWADFERTAQMRASKMEKMSQRNAELKAALTMGGQVKEGDPVQ